MQRNLLTFLCVSLLMTSAADAGTVTVGAAIQFAQDIRLTKVDDVQFGMVKAGVPGVISIDTHGTLTDPQGLAIGGTPSSGVMEVEVNMLIAV